MTTIERRLVSIVRGRFGAFDRRRETGYVPGSEKYVLFEARNRGSIRKAPRGILAMVPGLTGHRFVRFFVRILARLFVRAADARISTSVPDSGIERQAAALP